MTPSRHQTIVNEAQAVEAILALLDDPANGDDAAPVTIPTRSVCITTDAAVEGIHLDSRLSRWQSGYRAAAAALSDLAAMGATPCVVTCAIEVAAEDWSGAVDQVAGVSARCRECGARLVGGDLVSAGAPRTATTVTCVGSVGATASSLRRSNAQVEDLLVVTGQLGRSAAALQRLGDPRRDIDRYLVPPHRAVAGQIVARHARAAIDLSDGLARDLGLLCAASGIGAVVDLDRLPLAREDRAIFGGAREHAIAAATHGDDYELLFSIDVDALSSLRTEIRARIPGLLLTEIGRCADTEITFRWSGGAVSVPDGYVHGRH